MKATMESTNSIVSLTADGKVKARVWECVSEDGVPFLGYMAFVQVMSSRDNSEFERDLQEYSHKAASPSTMRAISMRMIL